jgi:hypothetical protein
MTTAPAAAPGLFRHLQAPSGDLSLVIDDDGRVAYAYLRLGEQIVGDVWLYNVLPTPESVNWADRSQMPFLNPRPFCCDEAPARLNDDSRIEVRWLADGAELFVDEELTARIHVGDKPGQSRFAVKANPLARPLEEVR